MLMMKFVSLLLLVLPSVVIAFTPIPLRSPITRVQTSKGPSFTRIGGGSSIDSYVPYKAPDDTFQYAVSVGTKKANKPISKILILGIQAGLQVGIGKAMAIATWAAMPGLHATNPGLAKVIYGAIGLPIGLLMCLTSGSELFTGNTAIVGAAYLEKKVTTRQLLKSWIWSYVGNLIGCMALASLAQYAGVFKTSAAAFVTVANTKSSHTFGVAVARGVLCNWLVTTAVWLSLACSDVVSKFTVILPIITIFAALGFEHSVANMFIGPFATLNGGPGFLSFFLKNLVPVTLGNIIAGFVFVAGINHFAFGSFGRKE